MSARTAMYALRDIAREIIVLHEPANPGLESNLRRVSKCLDAGGALYGYYGSGKSLLSLLYSLYKTLLGEPTVVIEAYSVLRSRREQSFSSFSPTLEVLGILNESINNGEKVGHAITRWLESIGDGAKLKLNDLYDIFRRFMDVKISISGEGFEKLLNLIDILEEKLHIAHIVVDEFERLIVNPNVYGYRTRGELFEDFFMFVDRKRPNVGLSIPHTLRSMLDLETIARMQPMTQIIYEEKELLALFERFARVRAPSHLVEKLINELKELGIYFKVPRAVVSLVNEALERKDLREIASERIKFLCLVAYNFRTKSFRKRSLLCLFYAYAWLRQDIFDPISEEKLSNMLKSVCSLVHDAISGKILRSLHNKFYESLIEVCGAMDPRSILRIARNYNILERLGSVYVLSPQAIDNLLSSIQGELADILTKSYEIRFEPRSLLVELQLYGRE
ncbi:hypothetical protein PYJP_11040 [Pyrofollis japonicus]|uniref:hypothetical protein n=1 Tax=Pyrofollis japonicus TaxID=3060460 RepID=UPI00295AF1A1|nr:hypothetical protein [Pyrofollis japonicus]BEP17752.1 hypothetical protein PYJP_11040 [Pyrofollis japonicus]